MQRIRLYCIEGTIIDGFIDSGASNIGDIRLVDLLNTHTQKRKIGVSDCIIVKNSIQMLFKPKITEHNEGDELLFLDNDNETEEKEVPLDFILDESLELSKTISLEDKDYSVNIDQVVFAHSLSEYKGQRGERVRAQKTTLPMDIKILMVNNYLCEGKITVPAIAIQKGTIPKDIHVNKRFVAMSKVKLSYLHSTKKYFRFHDHLIVNTNLVRSFY
jgi:hypothetical protein